MNDKLTNLASLTPLLLLIGCSPPSLKLDKVGCFATEVVDVSSATGAAGAGFAADQILGGANTQDWSNAGCISSGSAWSPASESGGAEHMELQFAAPLRVDRVRIYENFGPGTVLKITLTNTLLPEQAPFILAADPDDIGQQQKCSILTFDPDMPDGFDFVRQSYDHLFIEMDTTLVPGFTEIDAVQLVGQLEDDRSAAPASCDFDNDGTADAIDTDFDGDEIEGNADKCPDDPEDIDGIEDEDGCPEEDPPPAEA
jgi:hypothetical protein